MRLRMLAKDSESGEENCPSVHDDLDGTEFVLVGPTVDSSLVENVLAGEGVVRIKREVVIEALRYDQAGTWIGAEQVTEWPAIQQACGWRETALQLAMPWRRYIDLHPELAGIVPQEELRAP